MKGSRFHIGKGRYQMLEHSRYKTFTYGRNSFAEPKQEVSETQAHGTYGALLFDKRWRERRQEVLAKDGNQCVICFSKNSLQVHHRQYHFIKALQQFKSPWDYEDSLLITLCDNCHSRGHSKYKIPNIYI